MSTTRKDNCCQKLLSDLFAWIRKVFIVLIAVALFLGIILVYIVYNLLCIVWNNISVISLLITCCISLYFTYRCSLWLNKKFHAIAIARERYRQLQILIKEAKYNEKTKQIRIPITINDELQPQKAIMSCTILTVYLSSTKYKDVIKKAMNYLHNHSNNANRYTLRKTNISVDQPITTRAIVDLLLHDTIEITVVSSNVYDGENVNVKIVIGNKFTGYFKMKYNANVKLTNELQQISHKCIQFNDNKSVNINGHLYIITGYPLEQYERHPITNYTLTQLHKTGIEFDIQDFINIKIQIDNMSETKVQKRTLYENKQTFYVKKSYLSSITIEEVIDEALIELNKMTVPKTYNIDKICTLGMALEDPITKFGYELKTEGIQMLVKMQYRHKIRNINVDCKYLKDSNDALDCPIYKGMVMNYEYSENKYDHLCNSTHFRNTYEEQKKCQEGYLCKSFIRFQNKSITLFDRCHNKLYRHPPRRNRQIQMGENYAFVINETESENKDAHAPIPEQYITEKEVSFGGVLKVCAGGIADLATYTPGPLAGKIVVGAIGMCTVGLAGFVVDAAAWGAMKGIRAVENSVDQLLKEKGDKNRYGYTENDGYLSALIKEVIKNGYKYDLCLLCKKEELQQKSKWYSRKRCRHDVTKCNKDTLLSIVDEKLEHIRHKAIDKPLRRDHMLALLLYTGGECNYALCGTQRNGDYKTWKWFDFCLYEAIYVLNEKETGKYRLYSGLRNVKMAKKQISNAYFVTYVSSSWHKQIAESFIKGDSMDDDSKGMLLEMDSNIRSDVNMICCDVSWVSKFEYESEILIARSIGKLNGVSLKVVDDASGIQIVSLKKSKY